jgi:hypothetical protein
LILVYTIMNLPIVIWIMRDQFESIPIELEQAALVDGASIWQAFVRIVVPIAGPGFVAAFILSLVFAWNEYFFAVVLSAADSPTLPIILAGQTSSQGTRWWSIGALATAAITPLIIIGLIMEKYIVKGLTAAPSSRLAGQATKHVQTRELPCQESRGARVWEKSSIRSTMPPMSLRLRRRNCDGLRSRKPIASHFQPATRPASREPLSRCPATIRTDQPVGVLTASPQLDDRQRFQVRAVCHAMSG